MSDERMMLERWNQKSDETETMKQKWFETDKKLNRTQNRGALCIPVLRRNEPTEGFRI